MNLIQRAIDFVLHVDKYLTLIIQQYGILTYAILFLIIFLETGLVITPFLPGDSLLFVAGTLAGAGALNVVFLFVLLSIAAIIGDTVNYWIGHHVGKRIIQHKWVNKEYIHRTKEFFHKHGGKTIILARFIPIIRTFAPFVAGVGAMRYPKFLAFNIVGGIALVALFVFAGYYFGGIPVVKENLTIVIMIIIVASFIPAVIEYLRHRRRHGHKTKMR